MKTKEMLVNLRLLDGSPVSTGYTPTKSKKTATPKSRGPTYEKSGKTNIRKLERFMHDSNSDLARFLTDIAKAKALARDRLRDESVRKEAIDMVYKLRRTERNTNAYIGRGSPPKLPCETEGATSEEKDDGEVGNGYSSPNQRRDGYLEATQSSGRKTR